MFVFGTYSSEFVLALYNAVLEIWEKIYIHDADYDEEMVKNCRNKLFILAGDLNLKANKCFLTWAKEWNVPVITLDETNWDETIQTVKDYVNLCCLNQVLVNFPVDQEKLKYDAGIDLYFTTPSPIILPKLKSTTVMTSQIVILPPLAHGIVYGRSSSHKLGIIQPGVVDALYTGKLGVSMMPFEDLEIKYGDRLSQIVIYPAGLGITPILNRTNFACIHYWPAFRGQRSSGMQNQNQ
ncbi:unnamed protein product [Euphydryas editha]|uniref:dUTPase-like domain-containing protein n=1 Tax=Euphydryas editha TaxID=104508 RepID=A0AAU9TNN5_EUPED|nr:unnamed protein product [Euphydryas editha]CAH2088817.1 unnamed protein product [Euphydryas editha]